MISTAPPSARRSAPSSASASNSMPDGRHDADAEAAHRILTVPNVLSFTRIIGSVALVALAWNGHERWFIGLFLAFLFTDWLDGKIAIIFHQRTVLGARLDTIGDVVLYLCLLVGVERLQPTFFREQWPLIAGMLLSYAVLVVMSLVKYRRIPAYHTRAAKTCWFLVCVGSVTLLAGGPIWPTQVALVGVVLTNLQAVAMTAILPNCEADVSSWWHARRLVRSGGRSGRAEEH